MEFQGSSVLKKGKEKKFNFSSLLENIISQVKIVDIIDLTYRFDTLTITQSFALRKKKGEKMTVTNPSRIVCSLFNPFVSKQFSNTN